MDLWMLIVTALAAVAAIASAIVAIVQAKDAKASRVDAIAARNESRVARDESVRLAGEANEAFVRQAEAQEKANALKEAENAPRPWSGPRHVSGDIYAITNTSGRTIVVERTEVYPPESKGYLHLEGQPGGVFELGDSVEFAVLRVSGGRPKKFTLFWRYQDEPESELNQQIQPL